LGIVQTYMSEIYVYYLNSTATTKVFTITIDILIGYLSDPKCYMLVLDSLFVFFFGLAVLVFLSMTGCVVFGSS